MKRIIIIAGPNGAGKTTFAREFLPNEAGLPTFINADLIAAGLNPFRPESGAFQEGEAKMSEEGSGLNKEPRDPFFVGVEAALRRAAKVAHRRAFETSGLVPISKGGEIVYVTPSPEIFGDDPEASAPPD